MQKTRALKTQLLKLGLQVLLYAFLFLALFAMLSLNNPALRRVSRTSAVTMSFFVMAMVLLTKVYGGFEIGQRTRRAIFTNIVLSTLISDFVTYVLLQIMNTNPSNPEANARFLFFTADLLLLVVAFVLQAMVACLLVLIGQNQYFRLNPPMNCCLITSSQQEAEHAARKISSIPQIYHLGEVISFDCPDWKETVLQHDAVFLSGIPHETEAEIQCFCYENKKPVYLRAQLEEVLLCCGHQTILEDTTFMQIHHTEPTLVQKIVKRALDILISLLSLIVLSPLMLVVSVLIQCDSKGGVFFRQERKTKDGKIFRIFKFRTMYPDSGNFSALQGDDRITPIGKWLRKFRIDELPQFINVLKGEMSLVGPRPEMLVNVENYISQVPEFRYREQMKAGITGLAQIEGKYNTTPQDKAMLDLLYIETFSLMNDCKLILRTLTVFFRRDSTEGFGKKKVNCPAMRTQSKNGSNGNSPNRDL